MFSIHLATFILNYVLQKNNLYMFKDIFIWSSNIFKFFWNIVFESILKRCFYKEVINEFWMISKKTFSRQLSWDVFSTFNNHFESILNTYFLKDVFKWMWMIFKKTFSRQLSWEVFTTLNNCFEFILKTCFHKDVYDSIWMISKNTILKQSLWDVF